VRVLASSKREQAGASRTMNVVVLVEVSRPAVAMPHTNPSIRVELDRSTCNSRWSCSTATVAVCCKAGAGSSMWSSAGPCGQSQSRRLAATKMRWGWKSPQGKRCHHQQRCASGMLL
jgi:hypothetical protein